MATQVVILRAVRSLAPHLARLKNATKAFFNGLLSRQRRSMSAGGLASFVYARYGLAGTTVNHKLLVRALCPPIAAAAVRTILLAPAEWHST